MRAIVDLIIALIIFISGGYMIEKSIYPVAKSATIIKIKQGLRPSLVSFTKKDDWAKYKDCTILSFPSFEILGKIITGNRLDHRCVVAEFPHGIFIKKVHPNSKLIYAIGPFLDL